MKKRTFLIIGLFLVTLLLSSHTSAAASHLPLSKLTPAVKQLTWQSNETARQVSQKEPDGLGKLTIENGTGYSAQVKVIDTSTNKAVYKVHVPAHHNYTITGIDDGTYALAFWLGTRTNGFGKKFTDTFVFNTTQTSYTVWTVTLHTVPNGNAPTEDISRGEFDQY
jgi:hypothetical protein